jgi:hypothetical protein
MLLLVSPDAMLATIVGTSGLDRGCAQIDVPLQMNPAGIPLFAQWAWLECRPCVPRPVSLPAAQREGPAAARGAVVFPCGPVSRPPDLPPVKGV